MPSASYTTTHLVDHPSSCRDGPESPRGGQEVVEAHAAQEALDAAAASEDHHMLYGRDGARGQRGSLHIHVRVRFHIIGNARI